MCIRDSYNPYGSNGYGQQYGQNMYGNGANQQYGQNMYGNGANQQYGQNTVSYTHLDVYKRQR